MSTVEWHTSQCGIFIKINSIFCSLWEIKVIRGRGWAEGLMVQRAIASLASLLDHQVGKTEHLQPAETSVESSLADWLHGSSYRRLYCRTSVGTIFYRWIGLVTTRTSTLLMLWCGSITVRSFVCRYFWRRHASGVGVLCFVEKVARMSPCWFVLFWMCFCLCKRHDRTQGHWKTSARVPGFP